MTLYIFQHIFSSAHYSKTLISCAFILLMAPQFKSEPMLAPLHFHIITSWAKSLGEGLLTTVLFSMGSGHLLNYPCHLPDWMPSPSHAIISYDWYFFFFYFFFKLRKGKGWGCEGKVWSSSLLKKEFYTHEHLDYVRVKFLFCIKKN